MQVILCDEFMLLMKAEMGGEGMGEHQELHKVHVRALKHRSNAATLLRHRVTGGETAVLVLTWHL